MNETYEKLVTELNAIRVSKGFDALTLTQHKKLCSEHYAEKDTDSWPDTEDMLSLYLEDQIWMANMWCGPEEDK